MLKLLLASVLALGCASSASDARSLRPISKPVASHVVFEVEQRLKMDADLNEFEFVLHANGTWRYVETRKQRIQKRGSGQLSRMQMNEIRQLLAGAKWNVTQAEVTCMAFAMTTLQYTVNGKPVWTDEMCGPQILDRASADRLAKIMAVVNPLIAS